MENKILFFVLAPEIYAAVHDKTVVILDTKNDTYTSLIDDAAHYLFQICKIKLIKIDNHYQSVEIENNLDAKKLNYWITFFLHKEFIQESTHPNLKSISSPLQLGGLVDYKWDFKTAWFPLAQASIFTLAKAFFTLAKVHSMLKKKGIGSILAFIKSIKRTKICIPTEHEVQEIIAAVDGASLIYPTKTFCLAWSATFVLLGLQRNWDVHLLIAVQTNPFYAHAWAELDGKVINDDPRVAQLLSIILKEPHS